MLVSMLAAASLAAVQPPASTAQAPAAQPPAAAPAPVRREGFRAPPVRARLLTTDLGRNDYPREARRRREQGTTGFEIDIAADGRVSACRITSSSGSATLDAATCEVMRSRLRFEPARDAQGNATADVSRSQFTWTLPAAVRSTTR